MNELLNDDQLLLRRTLVPYCQFGQHIKKYTFSLKQKLPNKEQNVQVSDTTKVLLIFCCLLPNQLLRFSFLIIHFSFIIWVVQVVVLMASMDAKATVAAALVAVTV